MTGDQSRFLDIGDRVCWQSDQADQGTVTEKNWAGITIEWDSRGEQQILHNDMARGRAGAEEISVMSSL